MAVFTPVKDMLYAAHLLPVVAWNLLTRRPACRHGWRWLLSICLAVGITWMIIGDVNGTVAVRKKHETGNNQVTPEHPQTKEIIRNAMNTVNNISNLLRKESSIMLNIINYDELSNSRYSNAILDHFQKTDKPKMQNISSSRMRNISHDLNTHFNALTDEEMQEEEQKFALRKQKIEETCSKYGLGKYQTAFSGQQKPLRYPPTPNYDVLYISRRHGFSYCPLYKVASTTWLHYLSLLAGANPRFLNSTSQQISTISRRFYPQLDYDEASLAVPSTLKFMLVRHPFERIVSAYRDKLENINSGHKHGVLHFYESYGRKIVQKYRQKNSTIIRVNLDEASSLPRPSGAEPTFQEFVKYLIDTDLVHYADDHWMPYYLYCTPCFIDYDVIALFDSLERDQKYLLQKLKLDKMLKPHWKHRTKGKKTSLIVEKYMNTLNKIEKHRLFEKYKIDFEMFDFRL